MMMGWPQSRPRRFGEERKQNLLPLLAVAYSHYQLLYPTTIDFYSLKDVIKPKGEIPSDKWKLGLGAIGRIKNAKNEQDLLRIMSKNILFNLRFY